MGVLKHIDFEVPGFGELPAGPSEHLGYRDAILALNPLAYWRLGETAGTTAVDASGHGYDGTYMPGVVLGEPGLLMHDSDGAARFPGGSAAATDHVTTPLGDAWLDGDWTILLHLTPDGFSDLRDVCGTEYSLGSEKGLAIRGYNSSASGFLGANVNDGTNVSMAFLSIGGFTAGTTYHAAVVRKASAGTLAAYLNGQLANTVAIAGGFAAGKAFNIGVSDEPAARWPGLLDEVAVFDAALTSGQVADLYRRAAWELAGP